MIDARQHIIGKLILFNLKTITVSETAMPLTANN